MSTEEKATFRLKINRDNDAESPREAENLGTMVTWHRRYTLGDEQPEINPMDWFESQHFSDDDVVLPLYLYDHGGLIMKCGPFHDPWDSGQVGWIYAKRDKITKEYGSFDGEIREKVKKTLLSEVETYCDYLQGNIWGFILEKVTICPNCKNETVEVWDSCFGFIGDEAKDQIAEYLGEEHLGILDMAWEERM